MEKLKQEIIDLGFDTNVEADIHIWNQIHASAKHNMKLRIESREDRRQIAAILADNGYGVRIENNSSNEGLIHIRDTIKPQMVPMDATIDASPEPEPESDAEPLPKQEEPSIDSEPPEQQNTNSITITLRKDSSSEKILRYMMEKDACVTNAELRKALDVPSASISAALTRLLLKGYIEQTATKTIYVVKPNLVWPTLEPESEPAPTSPEKTKIFVKANSFLNKIIEALSDSSESQLSLTQIAQHVRHSLPYTANRLYSLVKSKAVIKIKRGTYALNPKVEICDVPISTDESEIKALAFLEQNKDKLCSLEKISENVNAENLKSLLIKLAYQGKIYRYRDNYNKKKLYFAFNRPKSLAPGVRLINNPDKASQ